VLLQARTRSEIAPSEVASFRVSWMLTFTAARCGHAIGLTA
jgi:hypothetical protein